MATSFIDYNITDYAITDCSFYYGQCANLCSSYTHKKEETKKEKLNRTSKEKMFVSWKMYNQISLTLIEVKQLCKPKHLKYRLNH